MRSNAGMFVPFGSDRSSLPGILFSKCYGDIEINVPPNSLSDIVKKSYAYIVC